MRARRFLGVFRFAVAAIEIVALVGNFEYVLGFRLFATANFFSYFTVQSAFLAVAVLLVAGAFALFTDHDPPWLGIVRTMVTVYVIVSGIVFALIVSQASTFAYRIEVPWSDTLLHFVVPVLVIVAWTVDSVLAVNPPVPWSTLGWVLAYPVVWLAFTLVRGADLGWYPYFFLDEAQVGGWVGVLIGCLVCLVIFLALTAVFVAVNRWLWRMARARRAAPPAAPRRRATRAGSPAERR